MFYSPPRIRFARYRTDDDDRVEIISLRGEKLNWHLGHVSTEYIHPIFPAFVPRST